MSTHNIGFGRANGCGIPLSDTWNWQNVLYVSYLSIQEKKDKCNVQVGGNAAAGQPSNVVKTVFLQMPGQPKPKNPLKNRKNPLKADLVSDMKAYFTFYHTELYRTLTILKKNLSKTLWEKKKMLIDSIISFSMYMYVYLPLPKPHTGFVKFILSNLFYCLKIHLFVPIRIFSCVVHNWLRVNLLPLDKLSYISS